MKIYHYKEQTGEYLSESVARPSPLDDTFLIPAHATKNKPPSPKDGFARCFISSKWVQVIDNHHQIKYINLDKVVFNLGDEITPDMTDEPNPPIPSLIERKKQEIRFNFNQSELLPVEVDGVSYHGGYASVSKFDTAKRLSELGNLESVTFFDTSNQSHALSIADAITVILVLWQDYQAKFHQKQSLINEVDALGDDATQDDINGIDSDSFENLDV